MFHFASVFTSSAHQRLCTFSFFFPSTLLPWMILCDVIRVAERFIKHIISFCLLLVRILNKLLSAPKSELCFICVRGCSWGININSKSSIETLILYIFPAFPLEADFCRPEVGLIQQLFQSPVILCVYPYKLKQLDQYQYLGNCPPNPPLTQH